MFGMKILHVSLQYCSDGESHLPFSSERNLLDLATDFASPQVLNVIRTAYEAKGKQKGNQRSTNRRRPTTNKKKNQNIDTVNPLFHENIHSSLWF